MSRTFHFPAISQDLKQMKILRISLYSLLTIILMAVLFIYIRGRYIENTKAGDVKDIEFILIKGSYGYDTTRVSKDNAVILVTDKKEINEDQKIFFSFTENMNIVGSKKFQIQFWKNEGLLYFDLELNPWYKTVFNYKPKLAQKRLESYILQLEKNPTHYIYNLKVSSSEYPIKVKNDLKKLGFRLVIIVDTLPRYPEVSFYYCHEIIPPVKSTEIQSLNYEIENDSIISQTMQRIIKQIGTIDKVLNQSKLMKMYSHRSTELVKANTYVSLKLERGR
ncbi:MAG: hypothetical protein PHH28_15710 [Desulfuromonadaceae bacterium]|nr:hypothetical protein [Desulfuromonadaceae bacterium]